MIRLNRTGTRKGLLTLSLLLVPVLFWAQSNALTPYKVTVFQDAVQISQKGIVRFHQQKSEIPMQFETDPEFVNLVANGEFDVTWVRFRQDSVMKMLPVENWSEVLKANITKSMSIVYEIGGEYDEIDGNLRWVDQKKGLMLLHGTDGADYFLPLDQVRQVIVETFSDYQMKKMSGDQVMEIRINKDAPFVPIEMFSLHQGITWTPVCRIRVISSSKASLEQDALVENQLFDLPMVALEVSSGSVLAEGQLGGDILEMGQLALEKGDRILVNFRKNELAYESTFQCTVPWKTKVLGTRKDFSVKSLMRFDLPATTSFPCNQYAVIDENNRNIANIVVDEAKQNGKVELDLGTAKGVKVSCVEVEKKRSKKPIKVGDKQFNEVSVDGKIIVVNLSSKFVKMDLTREIMGEITAAGGGSTLVDTKKMKSLVWEMSIDTGQKKEIKYKYDFLELVE